MMMMISRSRLKTHFKILMNASMINIHCDCSWKYIEGEIFSNIFSQMSLGKIDMFNWFSQNEDSLFLSLGTREREKWEFGWHRLKTSLSNLEWNFRFPTSAFSGKIKFEPFFMSSRCRFNPLLNLSFSFSVLSLLSHSISFLCFFV